MKSIFACALSISLFCVAVAHGPDSASAAFLRIYGGPEFDGFNGTGYQFGGLHTRPGHPVNNTGTAVGAAFKYVSGTSYGTRAIRWNGSGADAIELGNLGTTIGGFSDNAAIAVNNSGTAVGYAEKHVSGTDHGWRAVRWDASGTTAMELANLGTNANGHTNSSANAVSDSGTIVGWAARWAPGTFTFLGGRAVRWDASGTSATELSHLGTDPTGLTRSEAHDVNEIGTVVGRAQKYISGTDKGYRAVRWDTSGAVTALEDLGTDNSGVTESHASDVNNTGTAVGFAKKYVSGSDKGYRALLWDVSGTAAIELGNLGTDNSGFTTSFARAINDSGIAIGVADKYQFGLFRGVRAVRWDSSGAVTELGNLGIDPFLTTTNSHAHAINASGIAVGEAQKPGFGSRAVYWGHDGRAIDLNTLIDPARGWELSSAFGISDTGWIAGTGAFDPDGPGGQVRYHRLFLLQIPEPATSILIVAASAIGAAYRRDRRVRSYDRLRS